MNQPSLLDRTVEILPVHPLHRLKPGESGLIESYVVEDEAVLRLAEMGLVPGEKVTVLKIAPLGDPIEIEVMRYRLCLRKTEAAKIQIRPCQ